ncbi:DUF4189 domain-containing protein [Nocardia sp. NPDC055321]
MSLLSRSGLAVVIASGATLLCAEAGTAHAAGNQYGAIATDYIQIFPAIDYPTQAAANQAAMDACGKYCVIKLELKNSCGSAAELPIRGWWGLVPMTSTVWWGTGATAADAEQMALAQTPWPLPAVAVAVQAAWGSTVTTAPFIKQTVCTSNAR